MAKRGRKPLAIPRRLFRWYCRIDLIAEVELLLEDPVRGKPAYGSRTEYLEALIEKDLAERRKVSLTTEPRGANMVHAHPTGEQHRPALHESRSMENAEGTDSIKKREDESGKE